MSTELQVMERAKKALSFVERKAELAELATKSQRIVEITNPAGYQECHAARMVLKNTRVDIQKAGKEAREDATKFSKAVIAKEKELVDMIQPEEDRLQALQAEWDAAREAERQAKVEAERQRVAGHQSRIAAIHAIPTEVTGRSALVIAGRIEKLRALEIGDDFEEFVGEASAAKASTLETLERLHAAQVEHEAEQDRIRAEREELERLRAEQAARLAAEEAEAAAKRAEADRIAREQREREAAEQRAREEDERAERQRQEEAARAEREQQERIDREQREAELAAERERQAAEQRRLDEERAKLERERADAEHVRQQAEAKAEAERLVNLTLNDAAHAAVRWFHDHGHKSIKVCTDLEHALRQPVEAAA